VFAHQNHMHKRGRHEWTYIASSAAKVPTPPGKMFAKVGDIDARERVFDFDRQELELIEPPLRVGFGDGFVTHCQFDTSADTSIVKWGDETTDEM
jgi:hypothetical protein